MDNNTLILLGLLVICWTLNPFLKKMMGSKLPANENMLFNHTLCSIIIVTYTVYMILNHKCDISNITSLSKKDMLLGVITSIVTVASSLLLIKLLQENEASHIMPQIQPCVLLLTLLVGCTIFNEKISRNKIRGSFIIVSGLVVINK